MRASVSGIALSRSNLLSACGGTLFVHSLPHALQRDTSNSAAVPVLPAATALALHDAVLEPAQARCVPNVFDDAQQAVHGIVVVAPDSALATHLHERYESADPREVDFALVFGGACVSLCRVLRDGRVDVLWRLQLRAAVTAHVHAVHVLAKERRVVLGLVYNRVLVLSLDEASPALGAFVHEDVFAPQLFACEESTLLYSAAFAGDSLDSLVMASGTVFGQVLLWSPSRSSEVRTTLADHEGAILGLDWTWDEAAASWLLASCSDDRSVRVWRVSHDTLELVECVAELYGHSARVWRCVFVRGDELLVVSCSEDCTAMVWSLDGKPRHVLRGHSGPIWRAVCAPELDLVVTGSADGTLRTYSLTSPLARYEHAQLSFGGDQLSAFAVASPDSVVLALRSGVIQRGSFEGTHELHRFDRPPKALSLSPGQGLVAVGLTSGEVAVLDNGNVLRWEAHPIATLIVCWLSESELMTSSAKGEAKLWHVSDRAQLHASFSLPRKRTPGKFLRTEADGVSMLLVGCKTGGLLLYAIPDEPQEELQGLSALPMRIPNDAKVQQLVALPGGIFAVCRHRVLELRVSRSSARPEFPFQLEIARTREYGGMATLLLGAAGGSTIVGGLHLDRDHREVVVCDFFRGVELYRGMLPDGSNRVSGQQLVLDDAQRVWLLAPAQSGRVLDRFGFVHSPRLPAVLGAPFHCQLTTAAVLVGGRHLITGSEDMTLRSFGLGDELALLAQDVCGDSAQHVRALAGCACCGLICAGGSMQLVQCLEVDEHSGAMRNLAYGNAFSKQQAHTRASLDEAMPRVCSVAVQAIGQVHVVAVGDTEGRVQLSVFQNNTLQDLPGASALSVAQDEVPIFSLCFAERDGLVVLAAGNSRGYIQTWSVDLTGAQELCSWKAHQNGVNSIASPSGPLSFVSGGDDEALCFAVLRDGAVEMERRISAHCSAVKSVAAYGRWVFSSGYDQRVHAWDTSDGVQGQPQQSKSTVVADVAALCVLREGDGVVQLGVFGQGMQILSFDLT